MIKSKPFYPSLVLLTAALLGLILTTGADAASITRDDLIARLRIRSDLVVVSEDGKSLSAVGDEVRVISGFTKEGKYRRDWSTNGTSFGYKIRQEWTIDASGKIHAVLEEFSEEEIDSKTGTPKDFKNPIGKAEFDIVDFGPFVYPLKAHQGKRVLLRFIPELASDRGAQDIGSFPILAKGVSIYDAEGFVWGSDLALDGRYSAITTHRGTLVLSFVKFRGAEPAGSASGPRIDIRLKDFPRVTLQSDSDFVPKGMNAVVYVKYLKDRRTTGLNSVHIQETTSEKRLYERLKEL